ncbi:MAG: symporter small accessory protein [Desulfurispora sp.]
MGAMDGGVLAALALSLGSALFCLVYGWQNWHSEK